MAYLFMEQNHLCNFGRRHHEEQFCETFFVFGPEAQEMSLQDISYLELWRPLCSGKQNHLVRSDRDSRANLMPIYDDLYQIKL